MFDLLPFMLASGNPLGLSITRHAAASKYDKVYLPFHSVRNSVSNQTVTIEKALKLSAVWACVNLRRSVISSMPVHLKDENKKISNHIVNFLLHSRPNAIMTPQIFWGTISTNLDLNGNAYVRILRNGGGDITGFELLNPKKVLPTIKDGKKIFIIVEKNAKKETVKKEYSTENIIHIMGLTRNGIVGLSPIEYAAETIGDLRAIERQYSFAVSNSMQPTAVVSTGQRKTEKGQREEIQSRFSEFTETGKTERRAMILDNGMKIESANFLSLSPQAAQLIENRTFGIEEICRAFGVPPVLIGHTAKVSTFGNSLEHTNQQFLTYGLNPTLCAIEQAFEKNIFSIETKLLNHTIHFNRSALLQADTAARFEAYNKAAQNGIFTTNEIRAWEDLPPSLEENADKLRVQVNMTTLENLGKSNE